MRWLLAGLIGTLALALLASTAWAHAGPYPVGRPPPHPGDVLTPKPGSLRAEDWFFWWRSNAPGFEDLKWYMYHHLGSSPLFVTDRQIIPRGPSMREVEAQTRAHARPVLLRLLDGDIPGDAQLRAAAHLSFGKVAREESHVRRMLSALDDLGSQPADVAEAAVLSLGMLRRARVEDQFDATLLAEVRVALLAVIEESGHPSRLRAVAALAYGLLADQPSAEQMPLHEGARRLHAVIDATGEREEPGVSLLVALGLHPEGTLDASLLSTVRRIARKGHVERGPVHTLVRATAVRLLGLAGTPGDVALLGDLLRRDDLDEHSQRSAVIALTILGERFPLRSAPRVPTLLLRAALESTAADARGLALLGLARRAAALVSRDVAPDPWVGLIAGVLRTKLETGGATGKAYAALGLGVLGRSLLREEVEPYAIVWERMSLALRAAAEDAERDERTRAAAMIGLGVARAGRTRALFRTTLADTALSPELRASAAWALGLNGEGPPAAVHALRAAIHDDAYVVRREAVRGLALFGHPLISSREPRAINLLLEDLAEDAKEVRRENTIVLLARFGCDRAIEPLAAIVKDPTEPALTRALAASALGSIGDLEYRSALDLLRKDENYRARSALLRDFLRLL